MTSVHRCAQVKRRLYNPMTSSVNIRGGLHRTVKQQLPVDTVVVLLVRSVACKRKLRVVIVGDLLMPASGALFTFRPMDLRGDLNQGYLQFCCKDDAWLVHLVMLIKSGTSGFIPGWLCLGSNRETDH